MKYHALAIGMAVAATLTVSACDNNGGGGGNGTGPTAQTPAAQKAAGTQTIAAGLPADSRFMAVAKAAGMDQTLGGPGPYTVLVPEDAAFARAPAGTFDTRPENRAQLTGVLTNLILPGTVLAQDIGKAIDNGNGKAALATMAGATLTATREGNRIVLSDASGGRAAITQADQTFSNGVVHRIDGLLMARAQGAAQGAGAPAAAGNTTGP